MHFEREYRPRPVTSAEAVADAMMVAQSRYLPQNPTFEDENRLELAIWAKSMGQCESGSLAAARFIAEKHRNLFTGVVLLNADKDAAELANGWGNHFRFLARDNNGRWFSGSPANHEIGVGSRSRLTLITANNSLDKLMHWVRKLDRGKWPNAEFIENVFANDPDVLPRTINGQVSDPLLIKHWKPNIKGAEGRDIVTKYFR